MRQLDSWETISARPNPGGQVKVVGRVMRLHRDAISTTVEKKGLGTHMVTGRIAACRRRSHILYLLGSVISICPDLVSRILSHDANALTFYRYRPVEYMQVRQAY